MTNSRLGTLQWGARSQGRLTMLERWQMTAHGVRAVLRAKLAQQSEAPLDVDVSRPTSGPAKRAEALLLETSPEWLVNHGHRAFAWALAFAARDDLRPDRELLYCACLLHDLGLVGAFFPAPGECFALSGARGAVERLREAGMPADRARVVGEAIALHLNLVVAIDPHGVEAHLLRAGTAMDVVGQDAERISTAFREQTLREIPRLDFADAVVPAIAEQARRSPDTRIGLLCARLGLIGRAKHAPLG